jgi:hypothetical protein
MFDEAIARRFDGLKAEYSQALYRYYVLLRELEKLKEDLLRMEAGLAEVERVKKDWEAQKAIDEAAAEDKEKTK